MSTQIIITEYSKSAITGKDIVTRRYSVPSAIALYKALGQEFTNSIGKPYGSPEFKLVTPSPLMAQAFDENPKSRFVFIQDGKGGRLEAMGL